MPKNGETFGQVHESIFGIVLHGITRLGLIVSASASGDFFFLLLLREPGAGEFCVPLFTRCISLVTAVS